MQAKKNKIISEYARMWPREVFDIIEEGKLKIRKDANLDKEENAILKKNGVRHNTVRYNICFMVYIQQK